MTIHDLLAFAGGTFSVDGGTKEGYYINFYYKDAEGDTRRDTLFDQLTRKEASDIVKGLTEAKRKVTSIIETYEDRLYT